MTQQGEGLMRAKDQLLTLPVEAGPVQPAAICSPSGEPKTGLETLPPEVPQGEIIELHKPFYLMKTFIQEIAHCPSPHIT